MGRHISSTLRSKPAPDLAWLARPACIHFFVRADPELIGLLAIDAGIGAFSHYRSSEQQKDTLRQIASAPDGYVTVAVTQGVIVGFLLLCHPGQLERWERVAGLYELSIETSRRWRRRGIANQLLAITFLLDPVWDRRIVVSQGYHWHWDVEGTGLSVFEYRDMFKQLFGQHGFTEFETDDPEISCETANLLMARIGPRSSEALRRSFCLDLFRPRLPALPLA